MSYFSVEHMRPETLITCPKPGRHRFSPLKKSINMDLSCMNRGGVSNNSDAKCIMVCDLELTLGSGKGITVISTGTKKEE